MPWNPLYLTEVIGISIRMPSAYTIKPIIANVNDIVKISGKPPGRIKTLSGELDKKLEIVFGITPK